MLSKLVKVDSSPLVKESTESVEVQELEFNDDNYKDLLRIAKKLFIHFHDKCKLITLRPSVELMYFRYNYNYYDTYHSLLKELGVPFFASMEQNKDYGHHLHIIFLQKNTNNSINKFLKEKFDIRHKLECHQHAIHQDNGKDLYNKFVYYCGIRQQSLKPEYVCNLSYKFNHEDYELNDTYFDLFKDVHDIKHRLEHLPKCNVCGHKEEDVAKINVCRKHYKKLFRIPDLDQESLQNLI